jgi:hypothetical protein
MGNNLEGGLRTRNGRRWTTKIRLEILNRLKRWGDLEQYAREAQQGISVVLLHQYLEISHLLRKLPEPEDALINWSLLFSVAKGALLYSEDATTKEWTVADLRPGGDLDTVLDDLQAIFSEMRLIKRIEKRAAKQQQKQSKDGGFKLKLAEVRFFGWNDRGLMAVKLIEELGAEKVEKLTLREFTALVRDRCLREGISWPKPFDACKAIVAWQEAYEKSFAST